MKRHRGLKRYYKNLLAGNNFEKLTGLNFEDPPGWPPNLHLHLTITDTEIIVLNEGNPTLIRYSVTLI